MLTRIFEIGVFLKKSLTWTQMYVLYKDLLIFSSKEVHIYSDLFFLPNKGPSSEMFTMASRKELEKEKTFADFSFPPLHWLNQQICKAIFVNYVPADFDVFFLLLLYCLKVLFIPFNLKKGSLFKTSRHSAELRIGFICITFINCWKASLLKDCPLMLQPFNINEFPLGIQVSWRVLFTDCKHKQGLILGHKNNLPDIPFLQTTIENKN